MVGAWLQRPGLYTGIVPLPNRRRISMCRPGCHNDALIIRISYLLHLYPFRLSSEIQIQMRPLVIAGAIWIGVLLSITVCHGQAIFVPSITHLNKYQRDLELKCPNYITLKENPENRLHFLYLETYGQSIHFV